MKDYVPQNSAAFAVWFANFIAQLQVLGAKYNVPADKIAQLVKDNSWTQYWVEARAAAEQQKKQLSDYFTGIVKGQLGAPALSEPTWAMPAGVPGEVPPGIYQRIREVANGIKSQKSIYSRADGELLGIVSPEEAGLVEGDFKPEFKLRSLSNYNLEADFRKFGLDALRVEFRYKSDNWQLAAILTSSPGTFSIIPNIAGDAEQLEVRAIAIKNNQTFGNYTPIFTEVIKP